MVKALSVFLLMLFSPMVWALSPYVYGDRVAANADINVVMAAVEAKLTKAGFNIAGKYAPTGLPGHGVIVVTDNALLGTIKRLGGANIVGAGIRVGVLSDGIVSYMEPEYWYRAFFRKSYGVAEKTVKSLQTKLAKTLGSRGKFGGDVAKSDLMQYQYMFGMESFESDKNLLMEHLTFEDAISAIRDTLARGVDKTQKVYEVVMPDQKIAVFGVAMNDPKEGEGWWVKTVGADNIAALPYEIYVINTKVNHLFARYRIALGWPAVGMGQFMRIVEAPYIIQDTLAHVAGSAGAAKP
jgi:hypothetical protein